MSKSEISGELTYDQDKPVRLDIFLSQSYPDYSRSTIQDSIEKEMVLVNKKPQKSKYKLKKYDLIKFTIQDREIDISDIKPEEIPLKIIFEDNNVLVIDKKAGVSSHPTQNQKEATLVNALLFHYSDITSAIHDPNSSKSRVRAGIVHRLDKDTTGIMIIAKNAKSLTHLSKQIQERNVRKRYLAICYGWPDKESGRLENFLGRDGSNRLRFTEVGEAKGKQAITLYDVISHYHDTRGNKYSLINFEILTGRTHQIRAQALLSGLAILGDKIYFTFESKRLSARLGAKRQLLHSYQLSITLPEKNLATEFTAEPPEDFTCVLAKLSPVKP